MLDNKPSSSAISNVPSAAKTPKTSKSKTSREPEPVLDPSQPQSVVQEIPTQPTEPEILLPQEPTPEVETRESLELLQEPASIESSSTPEAPVPSTPLTSPTTEQLDFSEIMVRSNAQLKRLGWTTEMGKDYLLKTYGKKSRHLLNDRELLEFLNYLESLPTSPNEE